MTQEEKNTRRDQVFSLMDKIEATIRQNTEDGDIAGQALMMLAISLLRANNASRETCQELASVAYDDLQEFALGAE